MKILVTGGAGFLGSHLCDLLIKKECEVVCIDNLLTGSKKNIDNLFKNKQFSFIEEDITKNIRIDSDLDCVFHLASPASPVDYQKHPEETALANSLGTLNLLKFSLTKKAKFLFASTSEVYGDPKENPQKETYWGNVNSFGPRSCYDESKRFGESLTYIYIHEHKLNARIIRIFNTYGPRMQKDDGRVVSNFINQALSGKPLTIYGDGKQTRSFCYVSDLIDGIYKAMFSKDTEGGIFNLGNPEEYSVLDLAQKIKSLTGSKSEIVYKPLPPDDPTQRRPDINKSKKVLGWEPKISADEGLKRTIDYYKTLI